MELAQLVAIGKRAEVPVVSRRRKYRHTDHQSFIGLRPVLFRRTSVLSSAVASRELEIRAQYWAFRGYEAYGELVPYELHFLVPARISCWTWGETWAHR